MPAVTDPLGIAVPTVEAWLAAHVAGAHPPFAFEVVAGGHSNLTYVVRGADDQRFVLRRPPLGPLLASAHDMRREHRIIAALGPTPVPVPPALAFCEDPDVTGAPFYVMGFVDGHVIRDRAAAESVLDPDARRRTAESLVDTLATLHAVDPDAVGIGDLARRDGYISRQLRRWYGQWQQSRTRDLPTVDQTHARLSGRIPHQRDTSVVHGDYRLDNTIVARRGSVVAVLDWEICTLGDPLADVGLLAVYWTGPDDAPSAWAGSATTAPGFPNRREVVERYGAVSRRDLTGIDFYVAFAYWKLACILEGVYSRYLGGALGSDRDPAELDPFKDQVDAAAERAAEIAGRLP